MSSLLFPTYIEKQRTQKSTPVLLTIEQGCLLEHNKGHVRPVGCCCASKTIATPPWSALILSLRKNRTLRIWQVSWLQFIRPLRLPGFPVASDGWSVPVTVAGAAADLHCIPFSIQRVSPYPGIHDSIVRLVYTLPKGSVNLLRKLFSIGQLRQADKLNIPAKDCLPPDGCSARTRPGHRGAKGGHYADTVSFARKSWTTSSKCSGES